MLIQGFSSCKQDCQQHHFHYLLWPFVQFEIEYHIYLYNWNGFLRELLHRQSKYIIFILPSITFLLSVCCDDLTDLSCRNCLIMPSKVYIKPKFVLTVKTSPIKNKKFKVVQHLLFSIFY